MGVILGQSGLWLFVVFVIDFLELWVFFQVFVYGWQRKSDVVSELFLELSLVSDDCYNFRVFLVIVVFLFFLVFVVNQVVDY